MQVQGKKFLEFFEGAEKRFTIPVYQRNYDWRLEHCEQLYNDLLDVAKFNFRNHFLGSIVYVFDEYKPGMEYLIIDGQQRIATLSLLLLSIHNLLEKEETTSKTELLKEQIKELYLIDKFSKGDKRIKLKPIKADSQAFLKLFNNDPEDYIYDSNITKNYLYFINRIKSAEILVDDLFEAIKRLAIVEIRLNSNDDDPQLIFESLNATGLGLTQADLVRNFVLMGKPQDIQEKFYESYWNQIEKNTQYSVDSFIRDYLTMKERIIPNKDKIYISFKKYIQKNYPGGNIEDLLKELLTFSRYYYRIAFSQDNNEKIKKMLKRINKLDVTVSYPFLLEIFDYHENNVINTDDLINILNIIESYAFRRLICNVPTNALNKVFMTLGREVKKYPDFKENYFKIFKYILINKKLSQRFPTNEEFSDMLKTRDIYNFKSKNKLHLLERIENYDNKEKVSIEELLNDGQLNIEHIMPQTLSSKWKESLGENWEEIHRKYLNALGNITLTGYNTKMSNKIFLEKRDMEKGFKDSKLSINKFLQNLDYWGEDTIIRRANKLTEIALKVWCYPETDYIGEAIDTYQYNLSEDYDFTGEKIKAYVLMNQEYPVDNWKDFYRNISQNLYNLDPNIFNGFLNDGTFTDGKKLISDKIEGLRNPIKITDNIYLESNLSAESIVKMVRLMLRKYGIEEEEVAINIAEKEDEELSETKKKRIEFWKGLLKLSNEKTRHHSNCKPSENSSIFGGSGIGGIGYYYTIALNYGAIGVYIDRGDKKENNFIFEVLLKNKEAIEELFGDNLIWDNSPNTRSCFIFKKYENGGLLDKENWTMVQNIMVDGMHKLIEAIDRYLDQIEVENRDYKSLIEYKNKIAKVNELRFNFWKSFLERRKNMIDVYEDISPSTYNFIGKEAGKSGLYFYFTITDYYGQVKLYIDRGKDKKEENKRIFDSLYENKKEIEETFDEELNWERKDNQRFSEIRKRYNFTTIDDRTTWGEIQEKMIEGMVKLEVAFKDYISNLI